MPEENEETVQEQIAREEANEGEEIYLEEAIFGDLKLVLETHAGGAKFEVEIYAKQPDGSYKAAVEYWFDSEQVARVKYKAILRALA